MHETHWAENGNSRLTVAILTYNNEQTIEECLESVAKQTTQPGKASIGEVLIIDDESSDDTLLKVREAQERLGYRFGLSAMGRHNISRGRNIGMREARNPGVVFLDSDAFAHDGSLTAIASGFENTKSRGGRRRRSRGL